MEKVKVLKEQLRQQRKRRRKIDSETASGIKLKNNVSFKQPAIIVENETLEPDGSSIGAGCEFSEGLTDGVKSFNLKKILQAKKPR